LLINFKQSVGIMWIQNSIACWNEAACKAAVSYERS
jgi:hypothetical protein